MTLVNPDSVPDGIKDEITRMVDGLVNTMQKSNVAFTSAQ